MIRTATLLSCVLCLPAAAQGLSIDFNARERSNTDPTPSPTEDGFVGFTIDDSGSTIGGVTVTLSNLSNDRFRDNLTDAGAFTYDDLYDDFLFYRGSGDASITLDGLVPDTAYSITLYAYDGASNDGSKADWYGNGSFLFQATIDDTAITSNDASAFTAQAITDASGTLVLLADPRDDLTGRQTNVFINGLQVSVVPTPATATLLAAASFALLPSRRRR